MKKIVMFYTGGKNSILALEKAKNQGYEVIELLVMLQEGKGVTWFSKINEELISTASFALGINISLVESSKEDYNELFEEQLIYLKEQGAEGCAFGNIDNLEHKNWCIERCKNVGMEGIFPLWNENRKELMREFLDKGFKGIISNVHEEYLSSEFIGKELDYSIIKTIDTELDGIGTEGDKYNIFVIDGPIFNFPIPYKEER